MEYTERFVLPFRWREFGSWFASAGRVTSENKSGRLRIVGAEFAAGQRKLDGIKVKVELITDNVAGKGMFLCAFLADLHHNELFEPFIGNPERFAEDYVSGRFVELCHGASEEHELFIPEKGWVLPSIWRFLFQSIGLRQKSSERMPDLLVFAFKPGVSLPVLFATQSFDYFGSAQKLKEQLVLGDFFSLLHLPAEADESEIQRAYIMSCREQQLQSNQKIVPELIRRRSARFMRIKHGYQVWTEKLQRRNRFD